jgi:putative intracellular protease/amidase
MTLLFDRRSFVHSMAGLVAGYKLIPFRDSIAKQAAAGHLQQQSQPGRTYVCPPCGLECDKLTFDKPGTCPGCGMKLVPTSAGDDSPPAVTILLFNGVEIIDYAGPWEVFGAAGFQVHTVGEKIEPLTLVFGQKLTADYTFENSPKADILLVPGGGVSRAMENPALIRWIQASAKEARYVMSVCTGAFLLAKAGLLDGQTATTVHGMIDDLLAFPNTRVVYDKRYVDNGKIITTAGLSSGIDGAFHLVSKMLGIGQAQSVALNLEYHWEPDSGFARAALADRYLPDGLAYGKAALRGAETKMISTHGDTNRWEAKILISEPKTQDEIADLVRERIAANTAVWGMSRRLSHMRGVPELTGGKNGSEIRWKFTDTDGRDWSGVGLVEPAPEDKGKFILTLTIASNQQGASK